MASKAPAPRPKVLVEQLRILLEAVESDPSLYNASNSDMITFLNIEKWVNLADKLNDTFTGAKMSVPNWKYVLRYWSENVKKKMNLSKEKAALRKNPSITPEEAVVLADLENRPYDFIKEEESREIVDVTYVGKLDGDPTSGDDSAENSGSDGGVKFVVQLLNVFSSKPDDNPSPDGPKKRTIIMKEDDLEMDPTGKTKKFKIIFDQNVDEDAPQTQILGNQLDQLQVVSRDLEENISTIKSRIHMIKDMWKHRCGDN